MTKQYYFENKTYVKFCIDLNEIYFKPTMYVIVSLKCIFKFLKHTLQIFSFFLDNYIRFLEGKIHDKLLVFRGYDI